MGTLRFLLALCVVSAHTLGLSGFGVGGQTAVEIFFMVSGFLISYILSESPRYLTVRDFYVSRVLRIFPLYLIVTGLAWLLVIALTALGNENSVVSTFEGSNLLGKTLLTIGNIGIFLQDTSFFLSSEPGGLQIVTSLAGHENPLYKGLLTPQAWSLSLELMFYLLAPVIVRSTKVLSVLLVVSFALRLAVSSWNNLDPDLWVDRFFPIQLAAFSIGALSHRLLAPIYNAAGKVFKTDTLRATCYAAVVTLVTFYATIPLPETFKKPIVMLLVATCMPVLFLAQSEWKFDNFLSSLSFPIYLWHILVISVLSILFSKLDVHNGLALFLLTTAFSTVLSVAFNKLVDSKIQVLRSRFKRQISKGTLGLRDFYR